jgi:cysteine desulfurase
MSDAAPPTRGYLDAAPPTRGYLDAASAAPLHPVAREAFLAALADGWADPRRLYGAGRRARLLLDAARESMADSLGARADEVSFTASGIEALHAAVSGTAAGYRHTGAVLVHSAVEHSAVLQATRDHVAAGGSAVGVGVDAYGRIDAAEFAEAANGHGVAAAVLQAANHEVGTTQPIAHVRELIGAVPLVMDATQTVGHAPIPAGWSVLAADPRNWGAPPGAGVLAIRTGVRGKFTQPDDGGTERTAGPANIPAVLAAAASLRAVLADQHAERVRTAALIDDIRATVAATVPDTEVLGDPVDRLPHIATFSCLYVDGESVLAGLDQLGFAVSSGSSCTSSVLEPSHVLVAMGALTSGNIRVSVHRDTSLDEVHEFLRALPGVIATVRDQLGATGL